MLFEVSGVEVAPWVPPLVAFVISFFTSMGGVSGAFLLLPFQMSVLGFTSPAVSSTNQLYNIVAIPSGVWRYVREGRMVWPLTWVVVVGTLPGVLIGAVVRVRYLPDPRAFKVFAGFVLLYIGTRMVIDLVRRKGRPGTNVAAEQRFEASVKNLRAGKSEGLSGVAGRRLSLTSIAFDFQDEHFEVGTSGIFLLSFVVGIVGGIYGIGGGAIIAPFFVAIYGLPVYAVAGAALMGTFVTSVAGVAFYQAIAPFYPNTAVAPDWALGLLFGVGGMAGMYFGARAQKFVPARLIKIMLSLIILFTAIKYVVGF